MKFTETKIKGVYIVEVELREDERGYFARVFSRKELQDIGIDFSIAQVNQSLTKRKGIIRGMHYQKEPFAEDKLMMCVQGRTYNVAVDMRKDSITYTQWVGVELSPEFHNMFLVPKGCANGFQALEDNALVQYPVSADYNKESEYGVRWNDPAIGIEWPIQDGIVSDKDKSWPDI